VRIAALFAPRVHMDDRRGHGLRVTPQGYHDTAPSYHVRFTGVDPVEKRLGTVSIIVERHVVPVEEVNELLSHFGDEIIGRFGLPYPQRGVNIITLITDTSVERMSALTGKLGKIPGVQVRSLLAKPVAERIVHDPSPGQ
jgi:putative iron-only hydrogenase system regulator